jgi:hypothetical protein
MGRLRTNDAGTTTPVVLFLNDDLWNCFDQLAAALSREGVGPVRVITGNARRGRYVRLVERLLYREVLELERETDVERLTEMVDAGRVLDVQINERLFHRLGVASPFALLVARVTGVDVDRRATWIDKLELSHEVRRMGVQVPDQCRADELAPEAAVERFGLPLVLKRRTGTGGAEVRIACDIEAVHQALRDLGCELEDLLYQRYVHGHLMGYGAVRSAEGTHQEFTACESKGETDPLGPTVQVHTTRDEDLVREGRRVLEQLGCGPLAAIEFIRDVEGTLWFIDLSTRAWGNFLSFMPVGLDFPSGYLHALRGLGPADSWSRPEAGMTLRVVPTAAEDTRSPLGPVMVRLVGDLRPYRRRLGLRYCIAAMVGVFARRRARPQDGPPAPSPRSEVVVAAQVSGGEPSRDGR